MPLPGRDFRPLALVVLSAMTSVIPAGILAAQDAPQVAVTAATPTAPVTVGDLVAPIALYPDQLLGQVLTISATPQEVLDLGNWLIENDTLTGGKAQDAAKTAGFSTSAQYLALFPQVVDNMCQQIDWTTQLGDAYTDNAKSVMAAIQTKRQEAIKAGTLKTSSQMTVTTKKGDDGKSYIEITPTDPKVIYVPVYNPVNVYVTNPTPAPAAVTNTTVVVQQQSGVSSGEAAGIALLSFGIGMAVGAAIHTNYYPYPMWGYGGMYYGGRPYYPPPYRPPYYPGYHPAYGYHPPASYHWNQVNRQTNITINNNNYYNTINNNSNNRTRNANNANRPGQVAGGSRGGAGGNTRPSEYKGARPSTNDRPGGGMANANIRPGAGGAGTNRAGAGAGGAGRPEPAGASRPTASASDRGYGGGAGGSANRAAPQARPSSPSQGQGGGAFGSSGGGSGSSARAASSRGQASTGGGGAPHGGGGGGGGRRR